MIKLDGGAGEPLGPREVRQAPALILVIPDAALTPARAALLNGCEAAYHAGKWYVTVAPELLRDSQSFAEK